MYFFFFSFRADQSSLLTCKSTSSSSSFVGLIEIYTTFIVRRKWIIYNVLNKIVSCNKTFFIFFFFTNNRISTPGYLLSSRWYFNNMSAFAWQIIIKCYPLRSRLSDYHLIYFELSPFYPNVEKRKKYSTVGLKQKEHSHKI